MSVFSRLVLRNSAFGMGGQIAIKLLSFGFSVLIVRNLGADAYGQYAGVLAFGAMFVFISDLGLGPFAVRQVARNRDAPDGHAQAGALYGNVLVLRLLLSLLASVLMIGAAFLTGRPLVVVGAIALGAIGLMMYGVQGASDAVLAGFERLDLSAGAKVLNQAGFVLVGGLALWLGLGYYGLILANLIGVALMTAVCVRGVRRLGVRPGAAVPAAWPSLLRASVPFGLIAFTLGLSYKFDSLLLSLFRGDAETGYYNAAYNLVFSATVLSNVINVALYPAMTRQAVNAPESLPDTYGRAFRYLMAISLPIAMGTWAFADQLVPFLFTSAYAAAAPALRIVIWAAPLMFASEFLGYVVVIRGEESRVARSVIISTGLNVALNLYLVPRFGLLAAAAMTVATEAVLVGQYVWLLRGILARFNWNRTLLRPVLATALMGAVALLLPGLPVLASIALSGAVYVAGSLGLGVVGIEELRMVRGASSAGRAQ